MPISRTIPPMPDASVPMIDEGGRITPVWRNFLTALLALLAEMRAAL